MAHKGKRQRRRPTKNSQIVKPQEPTSIRHQFSIYIDLFNKCVIKLMVTVTTGLSCLAICMNQNLWFETAYYLWFETAYYLCSLRIQALDRLWYAAGSVNGPLSISKPIYTAWIPRLLPVVTYLSHKDNFSTIFP